MIAEPITRSISMKDAMNIKKLALAATLALAGFSALAPSIAMARPHHGHQECHWSHHHKVCHWVR
jgi:hypothetical protein